MDDLETRRAEYALASDPRIHWLFEDPSPLLSLSGDCLPGSLSYSSADEVATVRY